MGTHVYDGSAGYQGQCTIPEDSVSARSASAVNVPITGVANDLDAVRRELQGYVGAEAGIVRKHYMRPVLAGDPLSPEWVVLNGGDLWVPAAAPGAAGVRHQFCEALELPHGATLTKLKVWCTPYSGHSQLPQYMPRVQVNRIDPATGTSTTLDTVTDTTSPYGSYTGTRHSFEKALNVAISRSGYVYQLLFESEAGTGAQTQFTYHPYYELTFTSPTALDKGGC